MEVKAPFVIGDLVICISDGGPIPGAPFVGSIYVIDDIWWCDGCMSWECKVAGVHYGYGEYNNTSTFRLIDRKEVEDQVNQKIADKIMEKSWK